MYGFLQFIKKKKQILTSYLLIDIILTKVFLCYGCQFFKKIMIKYFERSGNYIMRK